MQIKKKCLFLFILSFKPCIQSIHALNGVESHSSVEKWLEFVLDGFGLTFQQLNSMMTTELYLYFDTPQSTKSFDENDMSTWGYVPWAKGSIPSLLNNVNGLYDTINNNNYTKIHGLFNRGPDDYPEVYRISDVEHRIYVEGYDFEFRHVDRKKSEVISKYKGSIQSEHGPFTFHNCRRGANYIVFDKETGVEVGRLRCATSKSWDVHWKRSVSCFRYASGKVMSVASEYIRYETMGERDRIHYGVCTREDYKSGKLVDSVPFEIFIHSSYLFLPNVIESKYNITGKYKLYKPMGAAYFVMDEQNEEYRVLFNYYFDRLEIRDQQGELLEQYFIPQTAYLLFAQCLTGVLSSLWEKPHSKEVARVFCGPEQNIDTIHEKPTCLQFPSGRRDTFYNKKMVDWYLQFFRPIKSVHDGACAGTELQTLHEPLVIAFWQYLVVVVTTFSGCITVCLVCALITFKICYKKVIPISRTRAAGFQRMNNHPNNEEA